MANHKPFDNLIMHPPTHSVYGSTLTSFHSALPTVHPLSTVLLLFGNDGNSHSLATPLQQVLWEDEKISLS